MAVKQGTFTEQAGTGSQAVTGVGFRPSLVFFISTGKTTTGSAVEAEWLFGVAVSSTDRRSSYCRDQDNVSPQVPIRGYDDTKCIFFLNTAGTVIAAADFVSMDADGFTVTWSTNDASARIIGYTAFSGLTNVKTGSISSPASTGSVGYTGLGFQPDAMMTIGRVSTATPPNSGVSPISFCFSAASSASDQWAIAWRDLNSGLPATGTDHVQKSGVILTLMNVTSGDTSIQLEANLTSFDSDGFTWNWTNISLGTGLNVFYVAFKGGNFKAGSITAPGSTGSQATTGIGFAPQWLMMSTMGTVAQTTSSAGHAHFGQAFGTAANTLSTFFGSGSNYNPSNTSSYISTSDFLRQMFVNHASPTTDFQASLTSLDSDGFTLNFTTVLAGNEKVYYLAIKTNDTVYIPGLVGRTHRRRRRGRHPAVSSPGGYF